eukprot:4921113-Pleurochrysis_carterae.AAC.1
MSTLAKARPRRTRSLTLRRVQRTASTAASARWRCLFWFFDLTSNGKPRCTGMAALPPQSSFSSIARIGSRMQRARNRIVLQRALTCPCENDDDIDRPQCVANKCSQCQDMKLLSKLICPAALEKARNIDLTWEGIKDVEKGVDEFGTLLTKTDLCVSTATVLCYMIERMREYLPTTGFITTSP